MISKDGANRYWATGIVVWWDTHNSGWHATCDYYDDGWIGDNDTDRGQVSTQGTLGTRYAARDGERMAGLSVAIATVKADAERLGIRFWGPTACPPALYYRGDGEDRDYPAPDGWCELLAAEAGRMGWDGPAVEAVR